MRKPTFTLDEVDALKNETADPNLIGRYNEAKNLEKFSSLRTSVETTVKENANIFLNDQLSDIDIPDGVKEIVLTYDMSPETLDFIVRSTGVKVSYADEGAVSDEIIHIVTKAQEAKANKNNQPLSFLTKTLGDSRLAHIIAIRDFEGEAGAKTQIEALYTNVEAGALSEGVSEIPEGDKCRLTIKYSALTVDGEKAGWLAPTVSVGKTVSGGGGGGNGERKKRTPAPEGYTSWKKWMESGVDTDAKAVVDALIKKHGVNWQLKISPTNALRQAKHPIMLAADDKNGD